MSAAPKMDEGVTQTRSDHVEDDVEKPSSSGPVKGGDLAAQLIGSQHITLTEEDVSCLMLGPGRNLTRGP